VPPQLWPLRLLIRLTLFLLPTLLYIRIYLRQHPIEYLRLNSHLPRGLIYGCAAGLLPIADLTLQSITAHKIPILPKSADTWLNVILAAPLTEEILFRGLLYREFSRLTNAVTGAIISSLLFAALHFPYWYFSHAKGGMDLAGSLIRIFAIGLLCCALTWKSRTLIAPIVFHFLNNLASSCAV
ncbi:MAG TPA: CPBP family intramembrane glutamic endopeptidase, partial [Tepidisphaeraceae bacterium]